MTARVFRYAVLLLLGTFFLLPLVAMFEFTTRGGLDGGRDLTAWRNVADDPLLLQAIVVSLELAALTSLLMLVLLLPTMVWVQLRLPRLSRTVEFLCLLPLVIPAVVLVVGIASLYSWVTYFLGDSPLTLTFVYVVLVLPYAYRALQAGLSAMDLRTLSEAARSLGAGWGTVLFRVVLPGVRNAVLSAALLAVALVLGEFTLASLLNFETLQVAINATGKRDAALSIAVSLAALLLAFGLLLVLSSVVERRRPRAAAGPDAADDGPPPDRADAAARVELPLTPTGGPP